MFSFGDNAGSVRQGFQDVEIFCFDHQLERARENEVPDENAFLVAPDDVRGGCAAAQRRSVDDIIMQQRRAVDKFNRSGELDVIVAFVIKQFRRSEGQHGAKALAPGIDQMARKFRNHFDRRIKPAQNLAVHRFKILISKRAQISDGGWKFRRALCGDRLAGCRGQSQNDAFRHGIVAICLQIGRWAAPGQA